MTMDLGFMIMLLGYIQKTRISGVSASTTINLTINNPVAVDLTSSLDALWDFSEGKGSTTADSSGIRIQEHCQALPGTRPIAVAACR